MIDRRRFIEAIGAAGLFGLMGTKVAGQTPKPEPTYTGTNPHQEAIRLVWEREDKTIREIEQRHAECEQKKQKEYVSAESRLWFDTETRRWDVKRVMPPGTLNSTKWLMVYYLIDDVEVSKWEVDLGRRTINQGWTET